MNRSPLFDLTGKVAVVTGSSRGIGRAIAEQMALAGAKVVISSRKAQPCEDVAAAIRAEGGQAIAVPCNVSRKPELEALVGAVMEAWGRIDILVCNAAANPYFGPMLEVSDSAMDKVIDTNIKSVVWLSNLVAPQMAERGEGSIIVISSIGGFVGSAVAGIYDMSKAAEQSLVKSLAVEWGAKGVRANCIAPGPIRTDFSAKLLEKYEGKPVPQPIPRFGEPIEIAGAAIFFASAASSYVTGQTLLVDGGRLIYVAG